MHLIQLGHETPAMRMDQTNDRYFRALILGWLSGADMVEAKQQKGEYHQGS
jgi:hypothetical protein